MPQKEPNDEELLLLLNGGDHAAFTVIYRRYWPVLYVFARNILRDDEAAGDVVQEIFTRLWQKAREIEPSGSLRAYLYTATRHLIINHIQRDKRRLGYQAVLAQMMAQGEETTEEQISYNELAARIEKGIAELPPTMRAVFELSRKEGLSHRAIAEALEMNDEAVKKNIHRALKLLRTQLSALLWSLLF